MDKVLDKEYLKELNNFRIHELRDIAREFGVKSPTSLTKNQILQELSDIAEGKKEPYINNNRVGRPPIHLVDRSLDFKIDPTAYVDPLISTNLLQSNDVKNGYLEFSSPLANENIFAKDEVVEGFFSLDFEAYGVIYKSILSENEDIKVPLFLAQKCGVRSGDFVKCVAREFGGNGYLVSEILEINNKPLPLNERAKFEQLLTIPAKEKLNYANIFNLDFDILEGKSYFIEYSNRKKIINKANEFANSFKNNTIVLINVNSEDNDYLISDHFIKFDIPFDMDFKFIAHSVNLILSHCKRLVENGENLVVILSNIGELVKIMDMALKGFADDKISTDTLLWFNKVIACAKNTEKGKLTLIAIDSLFLPKKFKEIVLYDIIPKFSNYYLKGNN